MTIAQEMKEIAKKSSYNNIKDVIEKILSEIRIASKKGEFKYEYVLGEDEKYYREIISKLICLGFSAHLFFEIDRVKDGYRLLDSSCTVVNYVDVKIYKLFISWKDS